MVWEMKVLFLPGFWPSITSCPHVPAATGWTFRWKAPPCPGPSTAGTEASIATMSTAPAVTMATKSTRPQELWGTAPYIWSTAAHGLTVTPPAPLFVTSWQDRRWVWSSSWSTWALTCRRWPSSRGWTPEHYWACSVMETELLSFKCAVMLVLCQ